VNGRRISPKIIAAVFCLLIGGMVAGIFGYRSYVRKRDAHYTASCANHFNILRLDLGVLENENPNLILPSTSDTRTALGTIIANSSASLDWLVGYGASCPESFRRDRSIGYVYVGDRLRLGDVVEKNIPILFCPAENHQGTRKVAFVFAGSPSVSNIGMIAELERAIARGESGEVSYSERAMKVLRSELNKRRQFLR
jgi:hypothetical protein